MEYFISVVKDNYTNFEGRARRKEYWMFILFAFIFSTAFGIIDGIIGQSLTSCTIPASVLIKQLQTQRHVPISAWKYTRTT